MGPGELSAPSPEAKVKACRKDVCPVFSRGGVQRTPPISRFPFLFTIENMHNIHSGLLLSLVVLSFSLPGCGGKPRPKDLPDLFPVSVTVEQEGTPVPGVVVSLNHVDGAAKWSASCETGSDGIAKNFFTNGKYKGVAAGKFKVCLRKIEREETEKVEIPPEPKDPFERHQWRQKYLDFQNTPDSYDLIEAKYYDPKLTTLEIEVVAGGKNEFTLDAGKPVRIQNQRKAQIQHHSETQPPPTPAVPR